MKTTTTTKATETEMLETYTNTEDGVESYVFACTIGGFGVSLRDLDSGEVVPYMVHGMTREAASAKAQTMAAGKRA